MSIEEKLEQIKIVNAGLQATLTQRNLRIAQLEEQLKDARSVSKGTREYKIAYKKGWQEALEAIQSEAHRAARALGVLSKGSWKEYREGETK